MESLVLQPTSENLYLSLSKDLIGRNSDVCAFVDLLFSIKHLASIAINSDWGSGKTFFVKQVKMILESMNDYYPNSENKLKIQGVYSKYRINKDIECEPYLCVYLDAWEHDNDEDPAMSLVDAILKEVVGVKFNKEIDIKVGKLVQHILDDVTGLSFSKYSECFETTDFLEQYKSSKQRDEAIQMFLDEILIERGNKLVLFIDELDRCKPDYAVRLLERLKHFWNNERITVVYSVNINQLQHTIKKFYGNDFDAVRYLQRIFDFYFDLPECDMSRFYSSIGIPNSFDLFQETCLSVMKYYKMSLRDSAKYYGNVKHAINKYYNVSDGTINSTPYGSVDSVLYYCFAPVMLGMLMCNIGDYNVFVRGQNIDILFSIIGEQLVESYSRLYFDDSTMDIKDVFRLFYDVVFNGRTNVSKIGKAHMANNMKAKLLKIVGGISY